MNDDFNNSHVSFIYICILKENPNQTKTILI